MTLRLGTILAVAVAVLGLSFLGTCFVLTWAFGDDQPIATLRSAECRVACLYLGYDGGSYDTDDCLCSDRRPYEQTVRQKKLRLPHKTKQD